MKNIRIITLLSALLAISCGAEYDEKGSSNSELMGVFDGWDKGKDKDKDKDKDKKGGKFGWGKNKKRKYLNCRIVVVNKVGDYSLDDYVRFTLYGKKRYKDYQDFLKNQSELPGLIESAMQKCKTDGIGKIDSRVCNSINTANFRGLSSFHYFNYPGFETYSGNWVCSLSEEKQD